MAYQTSEYSNSPDILMGVHGMRSPIHRTIDLNSITPGPGGLKIVPAGTFFSDLGNGYCRPLARARVMADTPAGETEIPVVTPQFFKAGDAISIVVPSGTVTLSSAAAGWVVGNTITVTLGGLAVPYTVVAEDIGGTLAATDAAIAEKLVTALTEAAAHLATASAEGAVVRLLSTSTTAHTLAVIETATNGVAGVSGATLTPTQPVGTITSADVEAGTITLAAPTTVALVAGQPIGTPSKALGIIVQTLSLGDENSIDAPEQGLYTSVNVRLELLPYYDSSIKADLPEVQAV